MHFYRKLSTHPDRPHPPLSKICPPFYGEKEEVSSSFSDENRAQLQPYKRSPVSFQRN